jgi:hypothetical protein
MEDLPEVICPGKEKTNLAAGRTARVSNDWNRK